MVLGGFWMDIGQPRDYLKGTGLYLSHIRSLQGEATQPVNESEFVEADWAQGNVLKVGRVDKAMRMVACDGGGGRECDAFPRRHARRDGQRKISQAPPDARRQYFRRQRREAARADNDRLEFEDWGEQRRAARRAGGGDGDGRPRARREARRLAGAAIRGGGLRR